MIVGVGGTGVGQQHLIPFFDIARPAGEAARPREPGTRRGRSASTPQIARPVGDIARIARELVLRRHRQSRGIGRIAAEGEPRLERRTLCGAGEADLPRGDAGRILPQQRVHSRVLIVGRQRAAEARQHRRFIIRGQHALAPRGTGGGLRVRRPAERLQGTRLRDEAGGGQRREAGEEGDDAGRAGGRRLALGGAAVRRFVRPAGMRHQEAGIAVERKGVGLADRLPLRQRGGDRSVRRGLRRLRRHVRHLRPIAVERVGHRRGRGGLPVLLRRGGDTGQGGEEQADGQGGGVHVDIIGPAPVSVLNETLHRTQQERALPHVFRFDSRPRHALHR